MSSLPLEPDATGGTSPYSPALPPRLVRETTKGRLIVVAPASALANSLGPKVKALPAALWILTDSGGGSPPGQPRVLTAEELEEETAPIAAGSAIVIESCDALGTPRRPTRLRAWLEEILRRRTVLFVASGPTPDPVMDAVRKLIPPNMRSRHFDAPAQDTGVFLERLGEGIRESARGAGPKPPPPLPGVASRWGLRLVALAGVLTAASWLALYFSHGAARNWRWLQLTPGPLVALLALVVSWPWLANAAAGRRLSCSECYARALARWSRLPRAPIAVTLLLLGALAARGLAWAYVPSTFLVLEESAQVTSAAGPAGACRGEDPCTLIVPRFGRLRFDGAEGSCSVEFEPKSGMIVIDLQSEDGCGAYDDEKPKPRGG